MPPRGRGKLAAVPEPPPRTPPPDLRDAVKDAIAGMTWLKPSDGGMKALALRQAAEIEEALDRAREYEVLAQEFAGDLDMLKRLKKLEAMCDATKTVGWLGTQLQGTLRDLGGAPAYRKLITTDKPVGGRLAELRAAAQQGPGQHDTEDLDPTSS